jgi:hypothetical protein
VFTQFLEAIIGALDLLEAISPRGVHARKIID